MAQTFDIRFAKSAGLAGFLEAPANEYRWKGAGSLSIDGQGISIAVQRGLLTLFARRSRRIAADNLIEIYREGDALRLEFSTPESARTVLPFWVRDSRAGAEIVRLLPTQRSVELDESPSSARRYRLDRRLAAAMLAGVAVLAFGAVMLARYFVLPPLLIETGDPASAGGELIRQPAAPGADQESDVGTNTSTWSPRDNPQVAARAPAAEIPSGVTAPRLAEPVELDPPALPDPLDSRETVADTDPMPTLETVESADANHPVIVAVPSPDGVIPIVPGDPAYAAARKELDLFLAERAANRDWWEVTTRIHNNAELDNPALWGLRDIELAISRSRRSSDSEFAEMLEARVRQYVY